MCCYARADWVFCAVLFALSCTLCHADTSPRINLGIFDATADWGLEPEFPPQLGEYKVPGRVDVTESEEGLVYDIFGNGDDILGKTDEGFYVYTERSGSWSLQARFQCIDSGGGHALSSAGFMIRENANATDSRFVRLHLNLAPPFGRGAVWLTFRTHDGNYARLLHYIDEPVFTEGVYLRLARDLDELAFVAEWSHDGENWKSAGRFFLEMPDQVAYGVSVTNHRDNDRLAHFRFSHVHFEAPLPYAERTIFSSEYQGGALKVQLTAINPREEIQEAHIHETIPDGWRLINASRGGELREGEIRWDLSLPTGATTIRYLIEGPNQTSRPIVFSGSINRSEVGGISEVSIYVYNNESMLRLIFLVISLVMLLTHGSIAWMYPSFRENRFFVFWLLSVSIYNLFDFSLPFTQITVDELVNQSLLISAVHEFSWVGMFVFSLLFVYSLYYPTIPKWFWLIAALSTVGISLYIIRWIYVIDLYLYALIMLESIRVLILVWRQGRPGAGLIIAGGTVYAILVFWGFLALLRLIPVTFETTMWLWPQIALIISMSLYLGHKFVQNQKELAILNTGLESRVQERTAELEKANERLLELDKLKTAFVSQASHDLRTPLTAIKGSLDNVLFGIAGELNEKQHRILERATRSVDRLGDLVNDVLDLARIESGRITLETSEAPFKALVESVIHAEQPAAFQKKIQLQFNAPSDDPKLQIDVGKIERVVSELVSNAIKYTPEGGKVEVGLALQNGAVELNVSDTGIGMSKEDGAKIWERFYRTRESQAFAKGSGLGLSIAKELVEMHGGALTVESKQGRGTTFTLSLPLDAKLSG